MNNQEKNKEEKKFFQTLQTAIFSLFDQLVSLNIVTSLVAAICVVLEGLILIHTLVLVLSTISQNKVYSFYIYLNYVNLASTFSVSFYTVTIAIAVSVLYICLFLLLIIMHWATYAKRRTSLSYSYLLRITGVAAILMKFILFQPIMTLLLSSLTCTENSLTSGARDLGVDCQSSGHIIFLSISCVVAFLLVILSTIGLFFFSDEEPTSKFPWAYNNRLTEMLKIIRKVFVSISLHLVSQNKSAVNVLIAISLLLCLACFYELYKKKYMPDRMVTYATHTIEGSIIYVNSSILLYIVSGIRMGEPLFLLIFTFFYLIVVIFVNQERVRRVLSTERIAQLKSAAEVETFGRVLIEKLHNSTATPETSIDGMIWLHVANCMNPYCVCLKLQKKMQDNSEEEIKEEKNSIFDEIGSQSQNKMFSSNKMKTISRGTNTFGDPMSYSLDSSKKELNVIKLLIQEISLWNEKHDDTPRLHIFLGYLKIACSKNKLSALYEAMCANESGPSLYEEYMIGRLMRRIEDMIILKDRRDQGSNEIDNMIKVQQILTEMQECMGETLKLFIGFWKELQEESPNFEYLGNTSHDISQNAAKIRSQYRELLEINSTNMYFRMLYALFVKRIMKDDFEALEVYEEIGRANNTVRMQNSYLTKSKFGYNGKTSLFILSGAMCNVGEVLCVNNEVCELLGYEKTEIVGHNVSMLMTPSLAQCHRKMIINFLRSGRDSTSKERMVLPLHKLGYLIPCNIIHRIVPNFQHGLQLIGFLSKVVDISDYCTMLEKDLSPDDLVIILSNEDWELLAFNIRAARLFGIKPAEANLGHYIRGEEKVSLKKLIPYFDDPRFHYFVKNNNSAEVLISPRMIHKIIDEKIELLKHPLAEKMEGTLFNPDDELERTREILSCNSEDYLRGPCSYADLNYCQEEGTKQYLLHQKLIMIYLEQLVERQIVKCSEQSEVVLKPDIKLENLILDDCCSQSQSSQSNSSTLEQEQKSVRHFKDRIKTQHNPFFTRCFIKLGVLILLLILGTAILEWVLIAVILKYLSTCFSNCSLIADHFIYFISTTNNFRTIYNIFLQYESNTSELYANRIAAYRNIIASESERLRELSYQIMHISHPYSNEHKALLESTVIQFEEKAASSSITNSSTYQNYTIGVALTKFCARATELQSYGEAFLKTGYLTADSTTLSELDRYMSYMIINGKGGLIKYISLSNEMYLNEMKEEFKSKYITIMIALIVDPIVVILLMIIFIPFILRVQANLLKIYDHLCLFTNDEILKWVEMCNNSASDIHSSISQINKTFNAESFEISSHYKEKDASTKNLSSPTIKEVSQETTKNPDTSDLLNSGLPEDEMAEMLQSKEEVTSERKRKMFSRISQEKTKKYILYLIIFILFLAAFRIITTICFIAMKSDTEFNFDLYEIYSNRESFFLLSLLFLREELVANEIISFFVHSQASKYFIDKAFEWEISYSATRGHLTKTHESLKEFLNNIDMLHCCNFLCKNTADWNVCQYSYNRLMTMGFNSVIINHLSYARKTDQKFRKIYKTYPNFSSQELRNFEIVKMNDVRNRFGKIGFNYVISSLYSLVENWLGNEHIKLNLIYSFYIISLFLIFLFLWKKMVSNLKMDIIKALGILNILPTSHLANQKEFIQEMNQSSLIN